MKTSTWAMVTLLLFCVCVCVYTALATRSAPEHAYPQATPPIVVTGVLGMIHFGATRP